MIGGLSAGAWYALRLWTATESARHQAVIYAATTTHSGGNTAFIARHFICNICLGTIKIEDITGTNGLGGIFMVNYFLL